MSAEAVQQAVAKGRRVRPRNGHDTLAAKTPKPPPDPLDALGRFMVTDEQVLAMKKTKMIWRQIVALGHLCVWAAPANGGKTALAKHAAGELAADGWTVLFFQEDASASDLPALHQHARDHGYRLLNSTLAGATPEEQVKALRALARDGADLSSTVMIFDTLKKYADLMSKGGTRAFFQLMRSLTLRGATIILLGHTNKHRGVDGKLIFEGVGDVRSDVDELLYIDATEKDPGGIVTLTMRPDKVRCAVQETTFQLNTRMMEIRVLDRVVNVAAILQAQQQREEDAPVIDAVNEALARGGMNHTELVKAVAEKVGKSKTVTERIVGRYLSDDPADPDAIWIETRLRTNNARYVSRRP